MSRLTLVERTFMGRVQAQRWFDSLRTTAWPYIWCIHDLRTRRWSVRALVEQGALREVSAGDEREQHGVGSRP